MTNYDKSAFLKGLNYDKSAFLDTPNYDKSAFLKGLNYDKSAFLDTPNYDKSAFLKGLNYDKSAFSGQMQSRRDSIDEDHLIRALRTRLPKLCPSGTIVIRP